MKSSIKKLLQKGAEVKMIKFEDKEGVDIETYNQETWNFENKSIKAWYRKIEVRQTNAIKFEGGSWLYFWLASESEWVNEEEKIFRVWDLCEGIKRNILTYKIK